MSHESGLSVPIRKELENGIFGSYFIRVRPKVAINRDYLADALRIMLHTLKANIDGEIAATCFAVEDLEITALVVA